MATPLSERRMADLEAYSDQNERASMNTVGVDISDLRSLIAEVRASRAEKAQATHCKHGHPKRFGPCPMCEFETEEDGDDR